MEIEEKTKDLFEMNPDEMRRKIAGLEEALKERESNLARAQRIARLGNWDWDIQKNTFWWSDEMYRIFGLNQDEFDGTQGSFLSFIHADDRESVKIAMNAALHQGKSYTIDHRIVLPDLTEKIVHEQAEVILNDAGNPVRMFGTVQDVTETVNTETELRLANIVFRNTLEGVAVTNTNGTILSVNPAFTTITGYSEQEVVGKNPRILKSDHQNAEFYKHMWTTLLETGHWQGEIWNRRKSGAAYLEWLTIIMVKDEHGKPCHYVSVFRDITEIRQKEEHIRYMAYHDPLTKLPNRLLFNDRLQHTLTAAQRRPKTVAVMFIDLDRFKFINDTLGHNIGDALLQAVASRIKESVRQDDTISRLGGDEFVILLSDIATSQDAAHIAQKVLEVLSRPYTLAGHELNITASIGISVYPEDGVDVQTLMKNADTAMYHAKELGKNAYQFYTANMNAKLLERMMLEKNLRRALDQKEFSLYYQPRIHIGNGKICGMEALIRWHHPEMGMILPSQFIPVAEETNLIFPMGEWVLRAACEQNKVWQDAGLPHLRVAVNVSGHQLRQHNLISIVKNVLNETGLPPEWLEIEITESVIMQHAEKNIQTLRELKDLGIQIAIDDFGTGYSSLNYLKRFPIDKLKIDRSFISDLSTDSDDMAITTAIIAVAHSLKLKVIAEGVETAEQLKFLKNKQCDEIQGYYFHRPMPVKAFAELLNGSEQT